MATMITNDCINCGACEPDDGLRLAGVDVAELLHPPRFHRLDISQAFGAAEYADPARPARRRPAFHRDWPGQARPRPRAHRRCRLGRRGRDVLLVDDAKTGVAAAFVVPDAELGSDASPQSRDPLAVIALSCLDDLGWRL